MIGENDVQDVQDVQDMTGVAFPSNSIATEEDAPVETVDEGVKIYPTEPDPDGFYFESSEDEVMDIATKINDNSKYVKRVITKDGRKVIIRTGNGEDLIKAERVLGKSPTRSENNMAIAAMVSTIDGKPLIYEDLKAMGMGDVLKITTAASEINFL